MAGDKCLQNVRFSDLLGVEQGTTGHFGPKIIIWNQFVVRQAVNTVGLHNSALVQLVLIWCSCSCKKKDKLSFHCLRDGFLRGCAHVRYGILTLKTRLPSQNLPEFLGSMVVCADALLDDLDIFSTTTQISLALDEVCQL